VFRDNTYSTLVSARHIVTSWCLTAARQPRVSQSGPSIHFTPQSLILPPVTIPLAHLRRTRRNLVTLDIISTAHSFALI
jgi:hypothetical protein